jgi:hypothetical protein
MKKLGDFVVLGGQILLHFIEEILDSAILNIVSKHEISPPQFNKPSFYALIQTQEMEYKVFRKSVALCIGSIKRIRVSCRV